MYFFEKYLRGFTDCFVLCGIEKAFDLAKMLIDAAMESDIYQNPGRLMNNVGNISKKPITIRNRMNFHTHLSQVP